MQKTKTDQTKQMFFANEDQIISSIIKPDHPFVKINKIIDFYEVTEVLKDLYSDLGKTGIPVEKGFKCLLVQFWEDYSDRQMEKATRENIAIRWFCGFGLTDETPGYTYFCKLRKRIGNEIIIQIFKEINEILRKNGLYGNVFKFIDASSIITKTALWEERDKAIADGEEKLNNAVINEYTKDKDAKWGAKGKNNIWFGYKRHQTVDMRYGLIEEVAVTPANVPDFKKVKQICPKQGMVFMDKGYDYQEVDDVLRRNNCHGAILRKKNNKQKNFELDSWISKVRMPFEGTFSKLRKRARYIGQSKVEAQCFMEAICHNLKKAVRYLPT